MNIHFVLLPILIPLTGAAIAVGLTRWPRLRAGWALGTLTTSLLVSLWLLTAVWQDGPLVFQSGGWQAPFGITLVADLLAVLLVVMTQIVGVTGLMYALGAKDKAVGYPAFYPLFLTLMTSLTGAFLTGDLFNLFVFAELLVISGTVLTAVSDDRFGVEAAYKYFFMSLLASMFMLLAVGSLYTAYGTLNMADLAQQIQTQPEQPLLWAGIALLTATFMIKSAVFPFHFWQPDFHTAAPTAVSAMLSSVVVKLGVYGFIRMTTLLFVEQAALLQTLLIVLGLGGIFYGGLAALGTHNAKRMLAYSTLAQIGFMLVGIGLGTTLSIAAALVFAFNHSLMKAAMLMLAGYVASRAPVKTAAFSVVTGVGRQLPLAGVLFFVGGLALSGLPPTGGFISKLLLFCSTATDNDVWVLALLALGGTLTLIYSSRAFMRIWWQENDDPKPLKPKGDQLWAPMLLIALVVVLGIWAEPLVSLAQDTAVWLLNPADYIEAVLNAAVAAN